MGAQGRMLTRSASEVEVHRALQSLLSSHFEDSISLSASAVHLAKTDEEQYKALVLGGKASFCAGNYEAAHEAYEKAVELDPQGLAAWEGVAEVEVAEGHQAKAVETYRRLLRIAKAAGAGQRLAKVREFLWRLAECYERMGCLAHAEAQLRELLGMPLASEEQRLEALCFLADVQIKVEEGIVQREIHARMEQETSKPRHLARSLSYVQRAVDASRSNDMEVEGGLAQTLKLIADATQPSPRFVRYHEHHLQRHLSLLGAYPPRSAARQEKRIEALHVCKRMIEATRGGCCTAFPFEAAIWLWEETEELYGGLRPQIPKSCSGNLHELMQGRPSGLGSITTAPRASVSGPLSTSPRGHLGNHAETPRSTSSPLSMSPRGHISPRPRDMTSPEKRRASFSDVPRSPSYNQRASMDGLLDAPNRRSIDRGTAGTSPPFGSALSQAALSVHDKENADHITDLSVTRRSTSFTGSDTIRMQLKDSHAVGGDKAGDKSGDTSPIMEEGGVMKSPFGAPLPPQPTASLLHSQSLAHSHSQSGLPPMAPHRRSTSFGGGGFALPGDPTDLLRSDLVTSKVEQCGLTLAHQFPWAASSYVAVGLALRRRLLAPNIPSTAAKRQQISKCLQTGVSRGADSAAGWLGLAELQYQERQYEKSYQTGVDGLQWSVKRRQRGHETLGQFALSMRLLVGRALRRMGRLEEAELAFKVLAGWVTEGEGAFSEMSGSPPKNIHQEALRGIAKVLLEQGGRPKAKYQYEKILGKALLGRGRAEHWAHSEYAWIAFEDGDLPTARHHLEMALEAAEVEGSAVTEWEIAEHHYKLGRVLWAMGDGAQREARDHLEAGSLYEGLAQAASLAWLGKWEAEVGEDLPAARDFFQASLSIDPDEKDAAEGLKKLMGGYDMSRVGSLADWAASSGERSFPGFASNSELKV